MKYGMLKNKTEYVMVRDGDELQIGERIEYDESQRLLAMAFNSGLISEGKLDV